MSRCQETGSGLRLYDYALPMIEENAQLSNQTLADDVLVAQDHDPDRERADAFQAGNPEVPERKPARSIPELYGGHAAWPAFGRLSAFRNNDTAVKPGVEERFHNLLPTENFELEWQVRKPFANQAWAV
jgi:hypothetical protein